jgi:hypothetical protein
MFEEDLEALILTVYITDKAAEAWSQNGIPLVRGTMVLTYAAAVTLTDQMARLLPSVPIYQQSQCRAMRNSIRTAFGVEFWERHP